MDTTHLWDMLAAAQWNLRTARQRMDGAGMARWSRRVGYLQRVIEIKEGKP